MTKFKQYLGILFSLVLSCLMIVAIPSCKGANDAVDEAHNDIHDLESGGLRTVKITVESDSNITVNSSNTFKVEESSAWATIKHQAFSLVKAKEGYRIKSQWKLDSASGAVLNDNDVFSSNATVYAESEALPKADERIKITVKTNDSHITLINDEHIIAKKGVTKWNEIEAEAKAKLKFSDGFELQSFRHGSDKGNVVLNDDTFGSDEEVYAVAKQKPKAPDNGGGSNPPGGGGGNPSDPSNPPGGGGGSNPPGGGTTPPPSSKEQYNVTFSLLKGRDLDSLNSISIKAKNLSDNKEHDKAFVANKGDKIQFTVTLKDVTNVEEWKVNGTSLEYGTASFTVTVDGVINVTALVDKSQFKAENNTIKGDTKDWKDKSDCRTTANGTLVIPSHIGSTNIKLVSSGGEMSRQSQYNNAQHVYIADGIEEISAQYFLGDVNNSSKLPYNKIESIRLPNTLKKIGNSTFYGLSCRVRYLRIPKSVTSIGSGAFKKYIYSNQSNPCLVGLSIYFEHESDEDVNALNLDSKWFYGLVDYNIRQTCPVKIFIKNEKLREKICTNYKYQSGYNINTWNPPFKFPTTGDTKDDPWQWNWTWINDWT